MKTSNLAAALCCLLLAACGTLAERQRDADWAKSGDVLKYQEAIK